MGDWLTPQTVIGVIALIGGLVSAIIAWRKEARTAPIEKDSSSVLQANSVTEMTVGAYKELYERLSNTLDELDENRNMNKKWDSWYHDLLVRWTVYRQEDTPPNSPKDTP